MSKVCVFSLLVCVSCLTLSASAVTLDAYGGVVGGTATPCVSATGWFHVEKNAKQQWRFCTPSGNPLYILGIYSVAPANDVDAMGSTYYKRMPAKYGDNGPKWAAAENRRIRDWGFNTLGTFASIYALPTHTDPSYPFDSKGLRSQPYKLPFIPMVRPAFYGMSNTNNYLTEAVKNMFYGHSSYYTGYVPPNGVADYFDAGIGKWATAAFNDTSYLRPFWKEIKNSPYQNYMIGINVDDGDQMYGFGAADAFPSGHANPNLGWIIATMSPLQTANSVKRVLYPTTTVFSKKAWRDQLAAKYTTIGALNAAWGSNYTTFDSSGVARGEQMAIGDGASTSFVYSLKTLTPSKFSMQFFVNGVPVGGDTGNGVIWGPGLKTSSVAYGTGAISLNFAVAPALNSVITVKYVQNGWAIGSGLLDEDGRLSHQLWLGADFISLTKTNANTKVDLNDCLYNTAAFYLGTSRNVVKAAFPNTMYLGPDSLGSWGSPSKPQVLQAAAKYVDVMVLGGPAMSQAMMDYTQQYFGDKPYFEGEFRAANPDSALSAYSQAGVSGFLNQAARGQDYYNNVTTLQGRATSSGSHPYIGSVWWQYIDNWSEHRNWGLVTSLDNAYDGKQAVTVQGIDQYGYSTGGEAGNYGDTITPVKQANAVVLTKIN